MTNQPMFYDICGLSFMQIIRTAASYFLIIRSFKWDRFVVNMQKLQVGVEFVFKLYND